MKASVNRITEQAKRRDTLGRNKVSTIMLPNNIGAKLDTIQQSVSSDSIEKMTHLILVDEETNTHWLLKYRILQIQGQNYDEDILLENMFHILKEQYPNIVESMNKWASALGDDDLVVIDKERGEEDDSK